MRTLRLREVGWSLVVIGASMLAGCELKDPPAAGGVPAAESSGVAEAAAADTATGAGAVTPVALPAVDTFVPRDVLDELPAIPAPAASPAPPAPSGNGPITATPAELLALRMGIVIPVQGVAASSLRDMYAEARGTRVHEALDILAPRGTPVLSATAGRVLKLHQSKAGGTMIYAADASDRFILLYAHLDTYAPGLAEGMPLVAGQQIGTVGTTGNAPPGTPHLHFGVLRGRPSQTWWRGEPVNPFPLFRP